MKIRTGFVSNSSSSSFVVAFKKAPKSLEELKVLLFGDEVFYPNPYSDPKIFPGASPGWSTSEVAETVWRDLKEAKSLTKRQVIKEFRGGHIIGSPGYDWNREHKLTDEERHAYWEELRRKRDDFCTKKAKEFVGENPGAVFYLFSYSDNDGDYFCALEHGGLFKKVPHRCISHH